MLWPIYYKPIGLHLISMHTSVNPTCILCSKEPETREHFIAKWDFYDSVRETYMYMRKLLSIPGLPDLQLQQLHYKNLDSLHS